MMNEQKAVDILITGPAVVGVGLRNWIRIAASQAGVTGWVRNNLDRTVSMHAEGPGETVDGFVDRVKRPSLPAALVSDTDVREAEIHGYTDFEIEY